MKIQVVPETIIWEYVAWRLGAREDGDLSHRAHFAKLPAKISLSSEFLDTWKRTVQVAVLKKCVEIFGFRTFLQMENDQVRRVRVTEPEFWAGLEWKFSHRGVDRLWEHLVGKAKGIEPSWPVVTPCDALFLGILEPVLLEQYSYPWLVANKAPWQVMTLFLLLRGFDTPTDLPWWKVFEKPEQVALPLRDLLIERTAWFFREVRGGLERFLQQDKSHRPPTGSSGTAAVDMDPSLSEQVREEYLYPSWDRPLSAAEGGAAPGRRTPAVNLSALGTPGEGPGRPTAEGPRWRFDYRTFAQVWLLQESCFGGRVGEKSPDEGPGRCHRAELVRRAVAFWTGEGTLGLDDARYLEGTLSQSRLLPEMDLLARTFRELEGVHSAREKD